MAHNFINLKENFKEQMPVKLRLKNPMLRSWILFQQTTHSIARCEDNLFRKMGMTYQQFVVIMTIKYAPSPVTQTDVYESLDRNDNTISLNIDRMEKAGLARGSRTFHADEQLGWWFLPKAKDYIKTLLGQPLNFCMK
jgi:hypothetical protein